jgi:hypothetical protein
MGLLHRIRGASQPRALPIVDVSGTVRTPVVGESHYQPALRAIAGPPRRGGVQVPVRARLIAEPSNPYDANAIAIHVEGAKVGYLSRDDAIAFKPLIAVSSAHGRTPDCEAIIFGGDATRSTQFCVWLHTVDPADAAG